MSVAGHFYIGLGSRVLILALAPARSTWSGYGGMISLGHAAFSVSGYAVALLAQGGSARLGWHAAGGDCRGGRVRRSSGRCRCAPGGLEFIMITLAFAQIFYHLAVRCAAWAATTDCRCWPGSSCRALAGDDIGFYYFVLALAGLASCCSTGWPPRASAARWWRSARTNQRMAAIGYPVYRLKLAATLSGGLAGRPAPCSPISARRHPHLLTWTRAASHRHGDPRRRAILGRAHRRGDLLLLEESISTHTEHWNLSRPLLLFIVPGGARGIMSLRRKLAKAERA